MFESRDINRVPEIRGFAHICPLAAHPADGGILRKKPQLIPHDPLLLVLHASEFAEIVLGQSIFIECFPKAGKQMVKQPVSPIEELLGAFRHLLEVRL